MIIIAVSQFGNSVRVRLHEHPYEPGDACGPDCYEQSSKRSYTAREDRPRDVRNQVALALVAAWMDPSLGHVELLRQVGAEQSALFPR